MKKKKTKSTPTAVAATTTTTSSAVDLKALISDHGVFFDSLIELIPARFYLSNDDADSKPWVKGLNKRTRDFLKHQTRKNIKLARRQRLDPDKVSQSSTLDLLNQSLQKNHSDDNEDDDSQMEPIDFDENTVNGDGKSVTYEALQERLRKKLESLRGNRGASEKYEKMRYVERKRKWDEGKSERNERNIEGSENKEEKEDIEKGIAFGKLKIGDDEKSNNKKRKISKAHELQKAKKLKEAKKENPFVAEKESWKAAISRATGEKVHDNPRLLKESLKKDKKKKEKNAEKWKERIGRTEKMKGDRQQKRTDNIKGRANEKKARKIAKREKKLMRPGFEGRKAGFITED